MDFSKSKSKTEIIRNYSTWMLRFEREVELKKAKTDDERMEIYKKYIKEMEKLSIVSERQALEEGYNKQVVIDLYRQGKMEEAHNYIKKYILPIIEPMGILLWDVVCQKFTFYGRSEGIEGLIPNSRYEEVIVNERKKNTRMTHKLIDWFKGEYSEMYRQVIDLNMPPIYDVKGQLYVNLFQGFLYKTPKIESDFHHIARQGVDAIWNHIYEVWASKNKKVFKYLKAWISHTVSCKRKLQTILYLKSGQGTGKSIISHFLTEKVLPAALGHTTEDSSILHQGAFNGVLSGKRLVVFEELSTVTQSSWMAISGRLKQLATNSTVFINEKHTKARNEPNNMNIMIFTNNNAVRIESDDRRYFVLDVSNEKVGDVKYFNPLQEYIKNDMVGELFYWECIDYAEKHSDFREQNMPVTQNKYDLINSNLDPLYQFIKENYLKRYTGIACEVSIPFGKFYTEYEIYCANKKKNAHPRNSMKVKLGEVKINIIPGSGNKRLIEPISYEDLYNSFDKKKWIHELDEIHTPEYVKKHLKELTKNMPNPEDVIEANS